MSYDPKLPGFIRSILFVTEKDDESYDAQTKPEQPANDVARYKEKVSKKHCEV
jgi:hypothetical protein